jgi:hypothetical protein
MDTDNGVFEASTTSGPEVISTPFLVDGTQGYRIRKIAPHYSRLNYKAYLRGAYLFVWNGIFRVLEKYPLCAGLPGNITGMN